MSQSTGILLCCLKWKRRCLPFRSTWIYPQFSLWGSCCSIFSFQCI